ncbi:hypothetical protein [Streptomyces mirabilis]|uniref:hypothetical protein n=1 Tax=Streptomyces mirabilis TaxID=68239 RepID=UPI0036EB702C
MGMGTMALAADRKSLPSLLLVANESDRELRSRYPREPASRDFHERIALGLVFTLFTGVGAGVLGWLSGQIAAAAALTGITIFVGVFTVVLMTIEVLRR